MGGKYFIVMTHALVNFSVSPRLEIWGLSRRLGLASFPGSSLLPRNNFTYDLIDRAGQRSYVKLLRGRREEPGNEASWVQGW